VFEAYRAPLCEIPDSLVQMIQSSPELVTLDLDMDHCSNRGSPRWNVDRLFEMIHTMFPQLRVLKLAGEFNLDWDLVSHQTCNPHPMRSFLMNHQHIHTLALDWEPNTWIDPVDPKAMQELFPALREFAGRQFMCRGVVQSDLRSQLEALEIRTGFADAAVAYGVADAVTTLPKLRRLVFPANSHSTDSYGLGRYYPIDDDSLQVILSAAPKLRELEITAEGEVEAVRVSGVPRILDVC
jgi:hypothetical protein